MHRKRYKYINGIKGVISIFLSVILLPFFSLAALLVESARYQSAVSIVDEVMGSSAMSTLAEYDPYLQERFGLLAVTESKVKNYSKYLQDNKKILSTTINVSNQKIKGMYPLADSDILYQQVLEYSKLNSPTTMLLDGLDLSSLVKQLEEATKLTSVFEMIGNTSDVIDEIITLTENMETLKKTVSDYEAAVVEFENAFQEFQNSVNALSAWCKWQKEEIDRINEYNANLAEGQEPILDCPQIDQGVYLSVDITRNIYAQEHGNLINCLNRYKNDMNTVLSNIQTIHNKLGSMATSTIGATLEKKEGDLDSVKNQIGKLANDPIGNKDKLKGLYDQKSSLEKEISDLKVGKTTQSAVKDGYSEMTEEFEKASEGYRESVINQICSVLSSEKVDVQNFNSGWVTENSMDLSWYHRVQLTGVISSSTVDQCIQKAQEKLQQDSIWAQMKAISKIFSSLIKTKGVFDPELNSMISQGYFTQNYGGLPSQKNRSSGTYKLIRENKADEALSKKIIADIQAANGSVSSLGTEIGGSQDIISKILQDINNFQSGFENTINNIKGFRIISALRELQRLFESCKNLITHLVEWLTEIGKRILELCIDQSAWAYEKLFFDEYLVKTLPNRTNYDSGSTMTGYSFSEVGLGQLKSFHTGTPLDSLGAIIQMIKSAVSGGTEKNFCGAELEYVIWGSRSEMINQLSTFMMLYLMRLILNLGPIFVNKEVAAMATAATIASWAVYLIEVLVEPLVDTVLLVNGEKVALLKSTIFLTPSGVIEMINKLVPLLEGSIKQEVKEGANEIKKTGNSGVGKYFSGLLEMDYSEHMMILMYLFGNKETHVKRLADIIQMEAAQKGMNLDVDHAYTCLRAEVKSSIKTVLPIPTLSSKEWQTVNRVHYRGY